MKVFWGLIGALAIITAALLIGGGDRGGDPSDGAGAIKQAPQRAAIDDSPQIVRPAPGESTAAAPTGPVESSAAAPTKSDNDEGVKIEPPPPIEAEAPASGEGRKNAQAQPPLQVEGVNDRPEGEGDEAALQPNAPAVIIEPESKDAGKMEAELEALIKDLQQGAKEVSPSVEEVDPEAKTQAAEQTDGAEEYKESPAPIEAGGAPTEAKPAPTEASLAPEGEEKPAPKPDPTKPEIVPSKFEQREDGSTLVDGRFVMRGKGTKEEPYQVTWDMLVATSELYDPRRDRLKIPERVKMLDGKYVTIVGYVAFPIVAEGANELLAMLNSWDGCCIGVPPTPYDAVEVRLRNDATAGQMLLNWGNVTGRFKVEPYLAANWLLGLYLMEDAVLKAESM